MFGVHARSSANRTVSLSCYRGDIDVGETTPTAFYRMPIGIPGQVGGMELRFRFTFVSVLDQYAVTVRDDDHSAWRELCRVPRDPPLNSNPINVQFMFRSSGEPDSNGQRLYATRVAFVSPFFFFFEFSNFSRCTRLCDSLRL
jgi:hypothetical protein